MSMDDLGTLGQVIARARELIDPALYTWAEAGAGEGVTVARNGVALNRLALVPGVLGDVSEIDTATSFLGVPMALPVFVAPIGSTQLYHPDSAVAVAAGATQAGTSSFCGNRTTAPWEEVAATAPGRHFLQLYVLGDHDWLAEVADRAERAGFAGLCVTVDSPVPAWRDRLVESGYDWRTEHGASQANLTALGSDDAYKARFTWRELEFLTGRTQLPVAIKGVLRARDAARAVECGVAGVYVSNHGGRALDQAISTIEVLAEIVAAVRGRAEVVVDGGFTRGTHVCKALALGARAVGIGRLQCWGLAVGGAEGVARVLELLGGETRTTMAMLGCRRLDELTSEHVRWSFPTYADDRIPRPPP